MPIVAHYSKIYLALTKTWIYSQIIHLRNFIPIVITKKKENVNIFPLEKIYSLVDDTRFFRLLFNEKYHKYFKYYPYFYKILKKEQSALLHSHFGYDGYEMLPLKRKLMIPMVTTFYGVDLSLVPKERPIWRERYHKLFEEGDLFLVEGNYMKKCLVDLGCPEEKVRVQHLGVNLDKIKYRARRIEKDGKVKILVAGHFREKKGIPYALEAIGRLKKKYNNIELTLIGDSMGAQREECEKRKIMDVIERYDLKKSVQMLGYQPYSVFLEEVKRHHIFLSPSINSSDGDTEGGAPVSITEASASGMPILSTYHCDIPEVVIDGKSGFLVPERDIDALTEKLEYLVKHHELWESMGIAGRKHINEEYNISAQVKKLEEIYKNLINCMGSGLYS